MIAMPDTLCTAFEGTKLIASGTLEAVAPKVKQVLDRGETAPVLIFDDETSRPIEVDFRGTVEDVLERLRPELVARGRGRPKLGVTAREVTLLPRHWDWLQSQPGGASVALRKLVEEAKRKGSDKDRLRIAQDTSYRFMSALAGNLDQFEEAARALFAADAARFKNCTAGWPPDVRDHAWKLALPALNV